MTTAATFHCPHLNANITLSIPRAQHIIEQHPRTWPDLRTEITATLANPDRIFPSKSDPEAQQFVKWFDTIRTGRYMIVIVVSQSDLDQHWIITAYTMRKLPKHKQYRT
jgi:hypothetical protein